MQHLEMFAFEYIYKPEDFGQSLGCYTPEIFAEELQKHRGESDFAAQFFPVKGMDILTADCDTATVFRQVIQPVQQIHQCGFARSGTTQDPECRTLFDRKAYIF